MDISEKDIDLSGTSTLECGIERAANKRGVWLEK